MRYVTEGYEPQDVLRFFEDISRIPRGSNNESAVAHYIYDWGKGLGLDAYIDDANNVILKKPGSEGCEHLPPVILQAHTDMVATKLPECDHDWLKDPLDLYIEDGKLRARGTTLGADDGNGVAYMMGVLSRKDLVHPPLECIFTSGEEIGLIGASKLDHTKYDGMRMINLDGGGLDQSRTCVSCAGALELKMTRPAVWQAARGTAVSLFIHGLQGGHSAGYLSLQRGNANKLMARIINHVSQYTRATIAAFDCGSMMNAVPADAKAIICVDDPDTALKEIRTTVAEIKDELRVLDPGFVCDVELCEAPERMLDEEESTRLVRFVLAVPAGIRDMNPEIPGAVLNSNNLAAVHVYDKELFVWTMNRSNTDSLQEAMGEEIKAMAAAFGFDVAVGAHFFGWKYDPDSRLRETHKKLFKQFFGIDLVEVSAHGGLETGVFYGAKPGMDIITMGPKSDGEHTPEEYVILDSFKEVFEYLCCLLEELTK